MSWQQSYLRISVARKKWHDYIRVKAVGKNKWAQIPGQGEQQAKFSLSSRILRPFQMKAVRSFETSRISTSATGRKT